MKLHVQLHFVFACFSITQWHSQHEYGKEGRKAVSAWPVNEHSDALLDRHGVSNRRSSDHFSNIMFRQTTKHTKHRITDPFLEYSIGGDVRTKDQRWGNRFYFMTSSCHISCLMGGQNTETQMLSFDEIFITGCTESCHFDNFQCSQWWRFRQNDDIFVSVKLGSLLWNITNAFMRYCNMTKCIDKV